MPAAHEITAAARSIAQCAGPDPTTLILSWGARADPLFRGLYEALRSAGHQLVTQRWTEAAFQRALREWTPNELGRLWLPEPVDGGFLLPRGASVPAAYAISLAPPPVRTLTEDEAQRWQMAERRAFGKVAEDARMAERLALVEWPHGPRQDGDERHSERALQRATLDALSADPEAIRALNRTWLARLSGAHELQLTCAYGTDLRCSAQARPWYAEAMEFGRGGQIVCLPGGEVYCALLETTGEGVAVIHVGGVQAELEVRGGQLKSWRYISPSDPPTGSGLEPLLQSIRDEGYPLCELGLGTNARARPLAVGSLIEKAADTAHIAFGSNAHFGGASTGAFHRDFSVLSPRIEVLTTPS